MAREYPTRSPPLAAMPASAAAGLPVIVGPRALGAMLSVVGELLMLPLLLLSTFRALKPGGICVAPVSASTAAFAPLAVCATDSVSFTHPLLLSCADIARLALPLLLGRLLTSASTSFSCMAPPLTPPPLPRGAAAPMSAVAEAAATACTRVSAPPMGPLACACPPVLRMLPCGCASLLLLPASVSSSI